MPDRSLDTLSEAFRPLACEWIARCAARGIPVLVVQTSRTPAEHAMNLVNGTSATALSLHLPRKMRWPTAQALSLTDPNRDRADAIDLAPYALFQLYGPDKLQWDPQDPVWWALGEECERVGLRWGGRWRQPFDPGHGELILPWTQARVAEERTRPWRATPGQAPTRTA